MERAWWIGGDPAKRLQGKNGDAQFWSQDTIDYYVKSLQGLRKVYGLELDAIGYRNEKGTSYGFVKALRKALNRTGFEKVKIHGFDNWPKWKFDVVPDMLADEALRDSRASISADVLNSSVRLRSMPGMTSGSTASRSKLTSDGQRCSKGQQIFVLECLAILACELHGLFNRFHWPGLDEQKCHELTLCFVRRHRLELLLAGTGDHGQP